VALEAASYQAEQYGALALVRNNFAWAHLSSRRPQAVYCHILSPQSASTRADAPFDRADTSRIDMNIAVLGCSIGAEVYSILSTIRSPRPDLDVRLCAVDNSAEVVKVAKKAVYTSQSSVFVGPSIFERMTDAEFGEMFEGDGMETTARRLVQMRYAAVFQLNEGA
jgi:hypothetical protein